MEQEPLSLLHRFVATGLKPKADAPWKEPPDFGWGLKAGRGSGRKRGLNHLDVEIASLSRLGWKTSIQG